MLINLDNYNAFAESGRITKGSWGGYGVHHTACLMSALVPGAKSEDACAAAGWPLWLAEVCVLLFDSFDDETYIAEGRELAVAIKSASDRGVDFDRVFRDLRLDSILPIALDAIGSGDEPWRGQCRDVVRWCIDNDGQAAEAAGAAEAAWAAWAAAAAWAAWAAEAAEAAGATKAARAERAAEAAGVAGAERVTAIDRIHQSLLKALSK